jgi:hypothetical protein
LTVTQTFLSYRPRSVRMSVGWNRIKPRLARWMERIDVIYNHVILWHVWMCARLQWLTEKRADGLQSTMISSKGARTTLPCERA